MFSLALGLNFSLYQIFILAIMAVVSVVVIRVGIKLVFGAIRNAAAQGARDAMRERQDTKSDD